MRGLVLGAALIGALRDVDTPGLLKRMPAQFVVLLPEAEMSGTAHTATPNAIQPRWLDGKRRQVLLGAGATRESGSNSLNDVGRDNGPPAIIPR